MSGAFTVNRAELLEAVAQMETFERRLTAAMAAADRHADQLHASWTGAAADEHRAAHSRWRHATEEMHAALVTMRRIAHGAHGNYAAAVTANTSMWTL